MAAKKEITPDFWGRGTCSPFWELRKTYLTPIDWVEEQYNFEEREEEKAIRETPRGTAVPALEHVVPSLCCATGRTNRCVRLLPPLQNNGVSPKRMWAHVHV